MSQIEAAPAPAAPITPPRADQRRGIDRIATFVLAGLVLAVLVMLGRVAQLQLAPSEGLKPFLSDRTTTVRLAGVHGDIQDRRGLSLAATHFARRVFIDPVEFLAAPPDAIPRLAEAMGVTPAFIAQRLAAKVDVTAQRVAAETDNDPATEPDGKPIRYVSLGNPIEDWREESVRALKIPGVHLEARPVRELVGGATVAPIVGMVGVDHEGRLGAELAAQAVVKPTAGRYTYVRDAAGKPLWATADAYVRPSRGQDVRLAVDLNIQQIVTEELNDGIHAAGAVGGRCVVLDPRSGELLAMADLIRPVEGLVDYDWKTVIPKTGIPGVRFRTLRADPMRAKVPEAARNRCLEDVYEPGSTFKTFVWAGITEAGLVRPAEIIETHGGIWRTPYGREIRDVTRRGPQPWTDVLINSSNIGMAQGAARMSFADLHALVRRFGFGSRTGIGGPGESAGIVISAKAWTKYDQTSVAMGHSVAVTPIQMVRAFSAFARTGDLAGTVPPIATFALDPEVSAAGVPGVRAVSRSAAELTRQTMVGVTENLDSRLLGKKENHFDVRYQAFGKSGTAEIPLGDPPKGQRRPKGSDGYFRGQYNSSFIAGAPVDEPRLVVLVVIDDPGPERIAKKEHYGSVVAGPVVRRILERSLAYLAVPPTFAPGEAAEKAKARAAARAGGGQGNSSDLEPTYRPD